MTAINAYFQQAETLPSAPLRRLGIIYNSYRLAVSVFLMLMVHITSKVNNGLMLPSLLQQTALSFYVLLSLILFGLFLVVTHQPRQQLLFGLILDIIILSLLLYANGAADLQLTMLYMVVVAASFLLLNSTQALIVTLLAVIFVIYQQFFYAIANSMSLVNLGDALLISASFLAVGFLSWSVSQRLVHVEGMALRQTHEVARLNTINQEVISQMINGMIVVDKRYVVLANSAAYQLLGIEPEIVSSINPDPTNKATRSQKSVKNSEILNKSGDKNLPNPLITFQKQLVEQHSSLIESYLTLATNQSRTFIYELPKIVGSSTINKLRIQIIPLKDASQLVLLEDLRREQTSAQQLKLASLGQLTASIAHEIRNPLAAISQASQLLMEEINEQAMTNDDINNDIDNDSNNRWLASHSAVDLEDNHELYKMIFAQTKRVNRIIEDVLKLSRQQQPHQQLIEIANWMPLFVNNHFYSHDVFLRIHTQLIIQFDTHQLEQVLINLINNGLRYSSYAHSHAYVEVEIYGLQNDVIIDILDAGDGVASENLEHLFEPFFTTDKTGTGLGLYLSQAFSEANHAQLSYVPEHAKTCFRLVIPAVASSIEPIKNFKA